MWMHLMPWNTHSQMVKVVKKIFLYLLIYLYWSIVVLHCYASFCYTAKWISHLYTYIPPTFLDFLPIYVTTEHGVEFPVWCSGFSLVISFIHSSVYMSIPISQFIHPPLFPLGIHMFVFYVCVFISALQIRPFYI